MKYSCDTCSKEHTAEAAVQHTAKRLQVARACRLDNFDNDSRFNANGRNVDNSNNWLRGIAQTNAETFMFTMNPRRDLWVKKGDVRFN